MEKGDIEENSVVKKIVEGDIVGVRNSDDYIGCFACNAKVKTDDDNVLGECTKCGMLVKVSKCKRLMVARVTVSGKDGKMHALTMFNDVIGSIVAGIEGGSIERKLLLAPTLRLSIDKSDVIYSAQKL